LRIEVDNAVKLKNAEEESSDTSSAFLNDEYWLKIHKKGTKNATGVQDKEIGLHFVR